MSNFDFIIIGAGIAGASVAAELSSRASVALLEMEERAEFHATGRSAAAFEPNYGSQPILALTRASRDFFFSPPAGFSDVPLFSQRSTLVVIPTGSTASSHDFLSDTRGMTEVGPDDILRLVPIFRPGYAERGFYTVETGDLDVHSLHQGYLRQFKTNGGKLMLSAAALAMTRESGLWQVATPAGTFSAPVVINATGAWGDNVAKLADVAPLGLQPKRRSIAVVPLLGYPDFMSWPFMVDVHETWYAKPQSGKLLISPADATPVEPHDAYVDDEILAGGIERFMEATTVEVTRLEHSWAGLRTFSPDESPVVGFDHSVEGFFWLVGQGGYGIQTAPAMARFAAALAAGQRVPEDILAEGLQLADISPQRFHL